MAEYYKGTVQQAVPGGEQLRWRSARPKVGNDLKFSSIYEVDLTLDTTRFQICFPTRNAEPYFVDGMPYIVREGEYFILNTHQHARAEGRSVEKMEGFCVFLTEDTLLEAAQALKVPMDHALDNPFHLPWQQRDFLVKPYRLSENSFGRHLKKLRAQLLSLPPNYLIDWDAFYTGIAESFLLGHLEIGRHMEAIRVVRKTTRKEIYERLTRVHAFILENYSQPITLDQLEKVAFLSKYYLVRLYREVYSLTPYQHILQLRMEKAKEMLGDDYSPTDVAYTLSYSDRRAFAKAFKSFSGLAPSAYQRIAQRQNLAGNRKRD